MNTLGTDWLSRFRYLLAVATGLLWTLAYPKFSVAGAAWLAPAALLAVAFGTRGAECFRVAYVAGLAHHLACLYWLLLIPVQWYPILGWVALSAVLALFPATWVWLSWRLYPIRRPYADNSSPWLQSIGVEASASWLERTMWAICCAALWVGLDMLQARLIGGFPWNFLGTSQYQLIPLIQSASITGVYGVTFIVVWFSTGLFCAVWALLKMPDRRYAWLGDLALPAIVVLACFAWGFGHVHAAPDSSRVLRVTVVQPSIPQTDIWDEKVNEERFAGLLERTHAALNDRPDLLLWPEAAVPELLRWHDPTFDAVTGVARSNQVWMIIGADDAVPDVGPPPKDEPLYYNSAWLIDPEGRIVANYRKRALVAFGEQIPFSRWLPFMKWFTPITGQFTPGEEVVHFPMDDLNMQTTPLICFEDTFPHLAREHANGQTDFLVNLTNDGWFRNSAAQWQHAAGAVFRAVENGVPLIRCTNNGLTCWVDEQGRIRELFRDEGGTVYGAGHALLTVSVPSSNQGTRTYYNRHGDRFGWACVIVAVIAVARRSIIGRRAKVATDMESKEGSMQ